MKKTQPRSRNQSSGPHEALTSKSFESTQRRNQNPKDFVESNDFTGKQNKLNLPKKFVNFLQNAALGKAGDMNAATDPKHNNCSEIRADIQNSLQSESERGLDTSKEEYGRCFESRSRSVQRKPKGKSFLTENTKPDQRADTVNITTIGPLTKESEFSTNKFLFQTYDNTSSFMSKKGLNTTKLANRTLFKYAEQPKQQGSGSKKGSTRASSTVKQNRGLNRSFYEVDSLAKQRTSPLHRRPSYNEKTQKVQDPAPLRNGNTVKQRKNGETKKNKSFVLDTSKERIDLKHMAEKEILESNIGLLAYHDLLIERGQTDMKILESLKDNFSNVTKEVIKYHGMVQQYDGMKQQFNEERQKTKKEKELLEFQLGVLKRENERLKSLNMKFMKHDQTHLEESIEKARNKSVVSKEIQEVITHEQKLTDLFVEREKVISFLRAKENQYISLLDAINSQGVNVKKIYRDHVNNGNDISEFEETRIRTLPDEFEEKKGKKNYIRPAMPHRLSKGKKFSSTEEDEVLDLGFKKTSKEKYGTKKQVGSDKGTLVFLDHKNGEQQSIHCSKFSYSNTTDYEDKESFETPELKPRMEVVEELSSELKERLKLDLSVMKNKGIKQYHDEFMEKWDEFTSSWKRAMAKDKTYQHMDHEHPQ